jgi:hypothetical protein
VVLTLVVVPLSNLSGNAWQQVLMGRPFYQQAWHGLKYGSANMGLLVALGTTAAFADSLMTMALAATDSSYMGHVYFESSVLILVFVCTGKYIEAKAKARTSDAVRSLLQLGAKTAVLLQLEPGGQTVLSAKEIPAELVQVLRGFDVVTCFCNEVKCGADAASHCSHPVCCANKSLLLACFAVIWCFLRELLQCASSMLASIHSEVSKGGLGPAGALA